MELRNLQTKVDKIFDTYIFNLLIEVMFERKVNSSKLLYKDKDDMSGYLGKVGRLGRLLSPQLRILIEIILVLECRCQRNKLLLTDHISSITAPLVMMLAQETTL